LLVYMVYRPCDLYESNSSPCGLNHEKIHKASSSTINIFINSLDNDSFTDR
jgi:hypothetical protein